MFVVFSQIKCLIQTKQCVIPAQLEKSAPIPRKFSFFSFNTPTPHTFSFLSINTPTPHKFVFSLLMYQSHMSFLFSLNTPIPCKFSFFSFNTPIFIYCHHHLYYSFWLAARVLLPVFNYIWVNNCVLFSSLNPTSCISGYYAMLASGTCTRCPAGKYCPVTTADPLDCPASECTI